MSDLDVVAKDLSVTLGASLSESLSSFAAARHGVEVERSAEKNCDPRCDEQSRADAA